MNIIEDIEEMRLTGREVPPDFFKKLFEKHGMGSSEIAMKLFKQIEAKDPECAFWMACAMIRLYHDLQDKNIHAGFILTVMEEAIPETLANYREYLTNT